MRFLHQHQTPRHVLPYLFYLALPLLGARYQLSMLGVVASSTSSCLEQVSAVCIPAV